MIPHSDSSLTELTAALRRTADSEFQRSAPFYAHLTREIADDPALLALIAEAPPAKRRPTLLLAAVRYLLFAQPQDPLAARYDAVAAGQPWPADSYAQFRAFCLARRDALLALLHERNVQTNEVRRCVQWLPAFALVSRLAGGRPLALVEVGASAGLNLLFDRYAYNYGAGQGRFGSSNVVLTCETRGTIPPPLSPAFPPIASRVGIDLNPIAATDGEATRWLQACVWPEHRERAAQLGQALALAAAEPPTLRRGDALALLPEVLADIPPGVPICLFHSATLAYFTREERSQFSALVARLAAERELYWLSSEGPGPAQQSVRARAEEWRRRDHEARSAGHGALPIPHWLVLTTFADGQSIEYPLAAVDQHGAWLEWFATTP